MVALLGGILGKLIEPVMGVVSEFVTDKDEREKLRTSLLLKSLDVDSELNKAAASVIVAEAQGASAAQRNWRPHLMYLIMFLLIYNGVLVPLINHFLDEPLPILEAWSSIPDQMWALLQIGLGGYIVGRSGEKMMESWKRK